MITSKGMRWTGHVALMGKKNAYRLLVGKPEERWTLGRPSRRWVDHRKMDLVYWIGLAQDMDQWWVLVNTVITLGVS
jgi:hypothetical protein